MLGRRTHATSRWIAGAALAAAALLSSMACLVTDAHAASRPRAPRALAPANGAHVQAVPPFSWSHVNRAAKYEFQLAADRQFRSSVFRGTYFTANSYATALTTLANGRYYWRVRAVARSGRAGRWSTTRAIEKAWTARPVLLGPARGTTIDYPRTPLVLRWSPVPYAYKYVVKVATDPSLAQPVVGQAAGIQTSGTAFAVPGTLAPGTYYWAVTPLDADKHPGLRSTVGSFTWRWPTRLDERTQLRVTDLDASPEVFDPQLRWTPIPGAVDYQVEVSTALERDASGRSFPAGSVVCCSERPTGTSLSPAKVLPNNTGSGIPGDPEQFGYWWRVRALDADGNAGDWNYGPPFDKTYPAHIDGLHLRDNLSDVPTDLDATTPVVDTSAPVLAWQPVAGASSYEVQVVPYVALPSSSGHVCDWSSTSSDTWDVLTATTAWTPLGNPGGHRPTGVLTGLTASSDGGHQPMDGASYCARVRARRDRDAQSKEVVSDWTTMAGGTQPAFRFVAPPAPTGGTLAMSSADYLQPAQFQSYASTPLFTWKPVDGAAGYFVVVARDQQFTKIVDLAFTNVPAYAPRRFLRPWTYPDETTSYWWAVVPAATRTGDIAPVPPTENSPRAFRKSSVPPVPASPLGGQSVVQQPTFQWRPTLGARSYTLQVSADPSFEDPLATVTTDSTGYSSLTALPVDTALYWRVRANDETGTGLNWSPTERFRRTLPAPLPLASNPFGGAGIPVLAWSGVQGAVSYGMHVEQADGTKRDFTTRSTAFTPVIFYGTGVWHWQVRANFGLGFGRVVSGGYFQPQPFARSIATPTGLRMVKRHRGMLLSWQPALMARRYRVQVSNSDSFSTILEQATTANTNFAPQMTMPGFTGGGPLYWRVATMDEGNNLGGWATRRLRNARASRIRVRGSLRHGRTGRLKVTVTDARHRRLSRAIVRAAGAGVIARPRRTNRFGRLSLRLHPIAKGSVTITAEKSGYAPATATVRVR